MVTVEKNIETLLEIGLDYNKENQLIFTSMHQNEF
jgi:hypothetical protein